MRSADPDKVRKVELLISNILRFGVIVSLMVVVFGTIVTYTRHLDYLTSKSELSRLTGSRSEFPHSIGAVWQGLLQFHGRAIVMTGLLLLIATPVIRVAVSIFAFVYERDRVFVVVTSVVLALLIFSFLVGTAGG